MTTAAEQIQIVKPMIQKLKQIIAEAEQEAQSMFQIPQSVRTVRWDLRNIPNEFDDLTVKQIDELLKFLYPWVFPDYEYRSFEHSWARMGGFITAQEQITVWSALITLKQIKTDNPVIDEYKAKNKRRWAIDSAIRDYYHSLREVYSQKPAPEPHELTDDDSYLLDVVTDFYRELERGQYWNIILEDFTDDQIKRGIMLSTRYKAVGSERKMIGIDIPIPKGALKWHMVDAGYTATTLHRQIIALVERR